MRKLQIGIMGSAEDLKYSKESQEIAKELGKLIAKEDAVLVFGAEKDCNSLSTVCARSAKENGATTVGITYEKTKECYDPDSCSIIIPCGMVRGGGRELALVLSCDVVICLGGGSGTLTEMAIAYQANIPIVCLSGIPGWAQKLAGKYFDNRKRLKCEKALTPEEALEKAKLLTKNVFEK